MKLFTEINNDLLQGYAVSQEVPDKDMSLKWKGAMIDHLLWRQICSFMRESNTKHGAEAMLRLFYHEQDHTWQAVVLHQEAIGLHVNEVENDQRNQALIGGLTQQGWEQFGTVHHHCSASAFQSGTDSHDECKSNGVHITLGHVDKDELGIDIRFVFRGQQYEASIADWVACPPQPAIGMVGTDGELGAKMAAVWNHHHLHSPRRADIDPEWLGRVQKKVYTQRAYTGYSRYGLANFSQKYPLTNPIAPPPAVLPPVPSYEHPEEIGADMMATTVVYDGTDTAAYELPEAVGELADELLAESNALTGSLLLSAHHDPYLNPDVEGTFQQALFAVLVSSQYPKLCSEIKELLDITGLIDSPLIIDCMI